MLKTWPNEKNSIKYRLTINPDFLAFLRARVSIMNETDVIPSIDKSGKIAIDWGVYGIPETFIVNAEGIIKYRHVGAVTKKVYKKINLIINKANNDS